MESNTLIRVTNRAYANVGYSIPEMNINRNFTYQETKEIPYGELFALSNIDGGRYILENCLIIHSKEAVNSLVGAVEPEYFYTEEDLTKIMKTGTLDEFLDCLDFAPEGAYGIIKELAVSLPLNDIDKRNAIKEKLGFDVTKAIEIDEQSKSDIEEATPVAAGNRRAAAPKTEINSTSIPARRASIPSKTE